MKWKLNNTEMDGLAKLLDRYCEALKASDEPEDKLFLAILEELRITVEQKKLMRKPEYKLTLKPYQAIAFWLSFSQIKNNGNQLANMLMQVCNGIHQQYIVK